MARAQGGEAAEAAWEVGSRRTIVKVWGWTQQAATVENSVSTAKLRTIRKIG
eukprot:COSAG05_NODE_16325_length_348_cov_1.124498_1_plen_51_part_10